MFCTECGRKKESNERFCANCGAKSGVENGELSATPFSGGYAQPPVKPNKKTVTMVICAVVGFAVIICATILILSAFNKSEKPLTVWEMLDLGEKYLFALEYEQALVQFLKVIDIEPMNPRGYTGAAESYIGLGREPDAIMILEQGLAVIGESSSIRTMLDHIIEQDHGPYPEPDSPPEPPVPGGPDDPPEPTPTPGPETPTTISDVYSAYHTLLTERVSSLGSSDGLSPGLWRAALIDFNNDGIDELIYYHSIFAGDYITGGYSIYGYDSVSKSVYLIHDHQGEMREPEDRQSSIRLRPELSIFRGEDNLIYLRWRIYEIRNSGHVHGVYDTLENNIMKTALTWSAVHFDAEHMDIFTVNGVGMALAPARAEFEKYESELLFMFRNWDLDFESYYGTAPAGYVNNINEILGILASHS